MNALDNAVEAVLARGDLATGVTVVAETPAGSLQRAYGTRFDGAPTAVDDITCLYCATKPVTALAALSLVEEGRLSLDASLAEHLPWLADHWIGRLTVEDLLNHRTNLHRVGAVLPMATEPSRRAALLLSLPEVDLEGTRAYSDFGAWFLLSHVVEAVAGEDFRDFAHRRVIAPYGIDERDLNLGIPPELLGPWRPDISINVYRREDTGLHPLAAEAAAIWACEWNPPFSSYGSARGLAQFYRGVLNDRAGAGTAVSQVTAVDATTARATYHDPRFEREASFGLGFMTNMPLFRLGDAPSERSFGHAGIGGGAVAWADPDHDLAAAIVVNAVFDELPDLLEARASIVSGIYDALDLDVTTEVGA